MAVVLTKINRGPGLIDSGTISVTGQVQQNTNYVISALMNVADRNDPTLVLSFTLELDGAVVRNETFACGQTDRNGAFVAPAFQYSTGAAVPSTARATFTLPQQLSFGVDLTLGTNTR